MNEANPHRSRLRRRRLREDRRDGPRELRLRSPRIWQGKESRFTWSRTVPTPTCSARGNVTRFIGSRSRAELPTCWASRFWTVPGALSGEGRRARGRVVVNGGNCAGADVNWVHYVHAAWAARADGSALRRAESRAVSHRRCHGRQASRSEWRAGRRGQLPSKRGASCSNDWGSRQERVHTLYYGTDPGRFRPPTDAERAEAAPQARLRGGDRPVVAFVGGPGRSAQGLDTLLSALANPEENGSSAGMPRLVVIGAPVCRRAGRRKNHTARSSFSAGFVATCPRSSDACRNAAW